MPSRRRCRLFDRAIALPTLLVAVLAFRTPCAGRRRQRVLRRDPMLVADLGIAGLSSGDRGRFHDWKRHEVGVRRAHRGRVDIDIALDVVRSRAVRTGWEDVVVRRRGSVEVVGLRSARGRRSTLRVRFSERDDELSVDVSVSAILNH